MSSRKPNMTSPSPSDDVNGVVSQLEALYRRLVALDAFLGAIDDIFGRLPWKSDGDREHRRDYNRLGYFVLRSAKMVTPLLSATDAAISAAMREKKR
jgi:hypothetical protein